VKRADTERDPRAYAITYGALHGRRRLRHRQCQRTRSPQVRRCPAIPIASVIRPHRAPDSADDRWLAYHGPVGPMRQRRTAGRAARSGRKLRHRVRVPIRPAKRSGRRFRPSSPSRGPRSRRRSQAPTATARPYASCPVKPAGVSTRGRSLYKRPRSERVHHRGRSHSHSRAPVTPLSS